MHRNGVSICEEQFNAITVAIAHEKGVSRIGVLRSFAVTVTLSGVFHKILAHQHSSMRVGARAKARPSMRMLKRFRPASRARNATPRIDIRCGVNVFAPQYEGTKGSSTNQGNTMAALARKQSGNSNVEIPPPSPELIEVAGCLPIPVRAFERPARARSAAAAVSAGENNPLPMQHPARPIPRPCRTWD